MGRNEEMNESIRKKRMEEIEGGSSILFCQIWTCWSQDK